MKILKQLFLLILFLLIQPDKTNAQTSISFDAGVTYNKLDFNANNINVVMTSKQGYITNVNIDYQLTRMLALEASPGVLQKNYSIKNNTDIYQNINNTYIQLPISIKYKIKLIINRLIASGSLGTYYAYWLKSNIDGLAPNIFDLSLDTENNEVIKLERIRYTHGFNSAQDDRSELGWAGKIGLEYKVINSFSCSLKGHYYQSLTDQQKHTIELQQPRYNRTFAISLGLGYYFN